MAIKIGLDKVVRTVSPADGKFFNISELNELVGGWIEPFKVGPVWVMYAEKTSIGLPQNEIASFFFESPFYGEVLVVPPQQLPTDWGILTEEDKSVTAEMVDNGFLLSLQNAIMLKKLREDNPGTNITPFEFFMGTHNIVAKEEYTFVPPDTNQIDSNTREFFTKVYDYISQAPAQFKKGILLDDSHVVVRTRTEDLDRVVKMMTDMYLETEDYEKCAVIKHIFDAVR
jgi:hypothetical protein